MWAHYANSYEGICIEYDFNEIKDFIGFIGKVDYQHPRPLISIKDLGTLKDGKFIASEINRSSSLFLIISSVIGLSFAINSAILLDKCTKEVLSFYGETIRETLKKFDKLLNYKVAFAELKNQTINFVLNGIIRKTYVLFACVAWNVPFS